MAQLSLPQLCPHCKKPVETGEPRRVCGLDQSQPDGIPVNLIGHRACAQNNEFVIIRGDTTS